MNIKIKYNRKKHVYVYNEKEIERDFFLLNSCFCNQSPNSSKSLQSNTLYPLPRISKHLQKRVSCSCSSRATRLFRVKIKEDRLSTALFLKNSISPHLLTRESCQIASLEFAKPRSNDICALRTLVSLRQNYVFNIYSNIHIRK